MVRSENIVVVQVVHHQETLQVFDLSRNFVEFSSEIILSYAITLVAIGLFCFFLSGFCGPSVIFPATIQRLPQNQKKKRTSKRSHFKLDNFLTFLLKNRLASFRVFSLFMSLFLWQSLLFVINNIKTSKVVLGKFIWPPQNGRKSMCSFWNSIRFIFKCRYIVSVEEQRGSSKHQEDILLDEGQHWTERRNELTEAQHSFAVVLWEEQLPAWANRGTVNGKQRPMSYRERT